MHSTQQKSAVVQLIYFLGFDSMVSSYASNVFTVLSSQSTVVSTRPYQPPSPPLLRARCPCILQVSRDTIKVIQSSPCTALVTSLRIFHLGLPPGYVPGTRGAHVRGIIQCKLPVPLSMQGNTVLCCCFSPHDVHCRVLWCH